MAVAEYRIDFYTISVRGDSEKRFVKDLFDEIVKDKSRVSKPLFAGTNSYFILDLAKKNDGKTYEGVFAKLRKDDVPRICNERGREKDIVLEEDEGLIEKNYFVYDPSLRLLTYQFNYVGSHSMRFENYLTRELPARAKLNPVVTSDAAARLMAGDVHLSSLDVSFALPTNTDFFPKDRVSKHILEFMDSLDAESIHIHVAANAPGRGVGNRLKKGAKTMLSMISDKTSPRVARARSHESGELIDLVAERLTTSVRVSMSRDKRYPLPRKMFKVLAEASDDVKEELSAYFGEENERLV